MAKISSELAEAWAKKFRREIEIGIISMGVAGFAAIIIPLISFKDGSDIEVLGGFLLGGVFSLLSIYYAIATLYVGTRTFEQYRKHCWGDVRLPEPRKNIINDGGK